MDSGLKKEWLHAEETRSARHWRLLSPVLSILTH